MKIMLNKSEAIRFKHNIIPDNKMNLVGWFVVMKWINMHHCSNDLEGFNKKDPMFLFQNPNFVHIQTSCLNTTTNPNLAVSNHD
jgi:hypothetical protein